MRIETENGDKFHCDKCNQDYFEDYPCGCNGFIDKDYNKKKIKYLKELEEQLHKLNSTNQGIRLGKTTASLLATHIDGYKKGCKDTEDKYQVVIKAINKFLPTACECNECKDIKNKIKELSNSEVKG